MMRDLVCTHCGRVERASAYTCASCGCPDGILDVRYDMDRARSGMTWEALAARPLNHWRYRELLPIEGEPPAWPVGWTPIVEARRLAADVGVARLRLKDEGRNPTASFKDRASSVGVVRAMECGPKTVACASTGNAASSLAGYAAMAGIPAVIFVPNTAPEPKIAQLLIYGATVFRVHGTYAQAYDLCTQACQALGWYNRNCAINPYLVEGKKTAGLEIAEQCRDEPPDWVVVSVGDGCTIAGIGKGLRQMRELGLIGWKTRLLGVQSSNVAPIARAFHAAPGGEWKPTIADSIDVPVPRNPRKALEAVRESDGAFVEVFDKSILLAIRQTGHLAGVFAEPAAAAAVAGVHAAVDRGIISPGASVLAMMTGSGLKDTRAALQAAGAPIDIPPDLDTVRRLCED